MDRTLDRRRAGELEAQILGVLWSASEELTAAEVLERLGGDLAYTTVAKVLDRLHAKRQVTKTRVGRSFRFGAVGEESAWIAGQVDRLLGFAGDRSAVLQRFVEGLDADDSATLARLLERSRRARREASR